MCSVSLVVSNDPKQIADLTMDAYLLRVPEETRGSKHKNVKVLKVFSIMLVLESGEEAMSHLTT